jgi:hypothetical protein
MSFHALTIFLDRLSGCDLSRLRLTQLEQKVQEVEDTYAAKLYQTQTELASTKSEMARLEQAALQPPQLPQTASDPPARGATSSLACEQQNQPIAYSIALLIH